jgi:hypothetical protein
MMVTMVLEDLFETHTIKKLLVLTESDEETVATYAKLQDDMNVETTYVLTSHVEDDRPLHVMRFRRMNTTKALCMSIGVFHRIVHDMEPFLSSFDTIFFEGTDPQCVYICIQVLKDIQRRGLLPANSVVATSDYFLRNMVELSDDQR